LIASRNINGPKGGAMSEPGNSATKAPPSEAKNAPRYSPGDPVCVASRDVVGHCRTPWYLRGRRGVVVAVHGKFHDPERLAYHKPGLPRLVLYKVRFRLCDIWAGYKESVDDQLEADLYEPWLEPIR
jgi:nitrile hydratase